MRKTAGLQTICWILLALDVLYSTAAVVIEPLPGWKMFSKLERIDYSFTDRAGRPLDLHDYIARGSYLGSAARLEDLARFACGRVPERGPFRFVDRTSGRVAVLAPPGCGVR